MGMCLDKIEKIKKKVKKSAKWLKKKTAFQKIINSPKKLMYHKKDPINSSFVIAQYAV